MPSTPLIRPYRTTDATGLWQCLEPVIRAGETYALPCDMSEAAALAYWTASDRETFIAETGGEMAGSYYLRANQAGGGAHVANCGYVTARGSEGRGIASAMCAHSLDHARARGFAAMQFNFVVASNERAVRLWQRMGFEIVGRLPAAFSHPRLGSIDAFVMYRLL